MRNDSKTKVYKAIYKACVRYELMKLKPRQAQINQKQCWGQQKLKR